MSNGVVNLIRRGFARMTGTIYDFKAKDASGNEVSLEKYKGKVVLIVNVASQCGLTNSNYTQLKEILDKYKADGLEVAAFPCNQFGGQEPACEIDIHNFVQNKFNFEPDLYSKIDVNGDKADPLYKWLKKEKVPYVCNPSPFNAYNIEGGTLTNGIKWNFTKFLIGRDGVPLQRYGPTTEPKSFEKDIVKALQQPKL